MRERYKKSKEEIKIGIKAIHRREKEQLKGEIDVRRLRKNLGRM